MLGGIKRGLGPDDVDGDQLSIILRVTRALQVIKFSIASVDCQMLKST